jgi:hypothetical protein
MNQERMAAKVAAEVMRTAAPGNADIVERRLGEAIKALQYLPVDYAFNDARQGQAAKGKIQQALDLIEEVLSDLPTEVTYVVIGVPDLDKAYHSVNDLIRDLERHGIKQDGVETHPSLRKELQGQPTFDKLLGPMYGGPKKVRYETQEAYNMLSS